MRLDPEKTVVLEILIGIPVSKEVRPEIGRVGEEEGIKPMKNQKVVNPCVKCGKPRVVVGVREEYVFQSLVTVTQNSCPDPECQKALEERWTREKLAKENRMGKVQAAKQKKQVKK
jgi:hypothetical protein